MVAKTKVWLRSTQKKLRAVPHHLLYRRWVRKVLYTLQHSSFPGSKGVPAYDVLRYFFIALFNGTIWYRAKGLAFSFLTAIPPLLIFIFTLIPYFPLNGIQDEFLDGLMDILPEKTYDYISSTINDVIGHRHKTLLSVGFITSIFLAANGMNGIIMSLNFANKSVEKRKYFSRYATCILMVFVLYIVIVFALVLMAGHKYLFQLIVQQGWFSDTKTNTLIFNLVRWIIMSLLSLFAVSFVYYIAPVKKQRIGLISPGAVLATIMFFVVGWALGIYFNNFNRYNLLYGSVGVLLMVMFWILFYCIVLLVGYELNISIYNGLLRKKINEERRSLRERLSKPQDSSR